MLYTVQTKQTESFLLFSMFTYCEAQLCKHTMVLKRLDNMSKHSIQDTDPRQSIVLAQLHAAGPATDEAHRERKGVDTRDAVPQVVVLLPQPLLAVVLRQLQDLLQAVRGGLVGAGVHFEGRLGGSDEQIPDQVHHTQHANAHPQFQIDETQREGLPHTEEQHQQAQVHHKGHCVVRQAFHIVTQESMHTTERRKVRITRLEKERTELERN